MALLGAATPENDSSGGPSRIPCGSCSAGHAGSEPPHRGGEEDHPLGHGPTEERRGERAVHAEVSQLIVFRGLEGSSNASWHMHGSLENLLTLTKKVL